jgi:HSP20 family protein
MASPREKQSEAREKQSEAGGTEAKGSGSSQSATATEERRPDRGDQGEGKTGGNGSAREEGARGRQVARSGGRLAGVQSWPVLLRAGVSASPWELVRRMSEDVEQLFETLRLGEAGIAPGAPGPSELRRSRDTGLSSRTLFAPPIEVQQRPDAVVVRLDLPGVQADEIDVTIDNGNLIISGERRQEHREEREGLVRTEISYGTFHRVIPLPGGADEDRMTAELRNGTLEVTVPIVARERGRRVPVQSQSQGQSQGKS